MNDKTLCDHVGTLKAVVSERGNEDLVLVIDPVEPEEENRIRRTLKNSSKLKDVLVRLVGKQVHWSEGNESGELCILLFYSQLGEVDLEPRECVVRDENGLYVRVDRR